MKKTQVFNEIQGNGQALHVTISQQDMMRRIRLHPGLKRTHVASEDKRPNRKPQACPSETQNTGKEKG